MTLDSILSNKDAICYLGVLAFLVSILIIIEVAPMYTRYKNKKGK